MSKVTTIPVLSVANDEFNAGRTGLALDIARAVCEGRVCWRIESNLRALSEGQARDLFDDLYAELGSGPSASAVYRFLDARYPATFVTRT